MVPFSVLVVRHLDIAGADRYLNAHAGRIDGFSAGILQRSVFSSGTALDDPGHAGIEKMSVVLKFEILVDVGEEEVSVVLREHDVDVVRLNADSDMVSHLCGVNSLAHE